LRNVNNAGWDAVDAGSALDETRYCGRRSRVVLTPRRRRQVSGNKFPPMTVTKKPDHRGEHEISRKPLRAGMPGVSGGPVVTTLVCFLLLHARLRVHRAPGIPHALYFRGEGLLHNSGAPAPRDRGGMTVNLGSPTPSVVVAQKEPAKYISDLILRACEYISDLILRGCEEISDLILRSGVFAASRRMAASPCVASIHPSRRAQMRAPQDEVRVFLILRRASRSDAFRDSMSVHVILFQVVFK
jgi:hypothetical protein